MGMNAHGRNHMRVTGGDINGFSGGFNIHSGNGHGPDSGIAGPFEHGIHVWFKTGVINMAVGIE